MADISKLEQQANLLMNNVSGWEQNVLTRIGKRIKKYGKLSLADVKSINNIATVKQDMDAITKELAKVTGYNISQIEQMYGELLEEQHLANEPLYDYRGKKFVPFAENRELQAIARAYAKTTGETMINLAKTKALCIVGANGKPIGMQKYYTDVLDKAVMQVTTGATDFHTAMRDSIIELGGSGVRVDYGGGVTRRLDTVVRQNLLWGAKQASTEYNTMIGDELGADGIEVDFHSNPRPSHEFMQGKQYVLGKARTINGIHFESADEALERLQDYGCLHYKTPIICGVSEPRYSHEELKRLNEQNAKRYTIDGKEYSGYDITQMQRRLESSVRNEKTTRDLANASGDNALVKRCNERIKAYQGKYNEISEITGIQGDKKRMSIPRGTATVKSEMLTPKTELTKKEFVKATTIEEAEQYAKKIGIQKANYNGIDLEVANAMNEAFENGINYCPAIKEKIKFVGSTQNRNIEMGEKLEEFYRKKLVEKYGNGNPKFIEHEAKNISKTLQAKVAPNNWAYAFNGNTSAVETEAKNIVKKYSGITVNSKIGSNSSTFLDEIILNVDDGYHPQGTKSIKSVFDHEIGHQINYTLDLENDYDMIAVWKKYTGGEKELGLSRYGKKNIDEFIAEGYSEYINSNAPREISKEIFEIIDKKVKGTIR